MDITQLLITLTAVLGILVVAILAIVPAMMQVPTIERTTGDGPNPRDDINLTA